MNTGTTSYSACTSTSTGQTYSSSGFTIGTKLFITEDCVDGYEVEDGYYASVSGLVYPTWFQVSGGYGFISSSGSCLDCTTYNSNQSSITIPQNGVASSYPITFTVAGITKPIELMSLTLNGYNHTFVGDVGMLLVSPNNNYYSLVTGRDGDDNDATNATVKLIRTVTPVWSGYTSGTYKNNSAAQDDVLFSPPSPTGFTIGTITPGFEVFETLPLGDINGTWKLYIQDFQGEDGGSLSSAQLEICVIKDASPTPTPGPTPTITPTATGPTPTPSSTLSPTPTPTQNNCFVGIPSASYYNYYDCCGNYKQGTTYEEVLFNITLPSTNILQYSPQPIVTSCVTPTPTSTPVPTPTPTVSNKSSYVRDCCNNVLYKLFSNNQYVVGDTYLLLSNNFCYTVVPTPSYQTPYQTLNDGPGFYKVGFGCYSTECQPCPPPQPTPGNVPVAGQSINECGVTTILPMGARCNVISQPTSANPNGGVLSIIVTGGTAPYTYTWTSPNGLVTTAQTIYNKPAGSYTSVVYDKWRDFTVTTTCTLVQSIDCSFSGSVVEYFTPTPTPTLTPTPSPTPTPTLPPTPIPLCEDSSFQKAVGATCAPYSNNNAFYEILYLGANSGTVRFDYSFSTFSPGSDVTIQVIYNNVLISNTPSISGGTGSIFFNYQPINSNYYVTVKFLNCHNFLYGNNFTTINIDYTCPQTCLCYTVGQSTFAEGYSTFEYTDCDTNELVTIWMNDFDTTYEVCSSTVPVATNYEGNQTFVRFNDICVGGLENCMFNNHTFCYTLSATTSPVTFGWIDYENQPQSQIVNPGVGQEITICAKKDSITYTGTSQYIEEGGFCIQNESCTGTSTCYQLNNSLNGGSGYNLWYYVDTNGTFTELIVNTDGPEFVCSKGFPSGVGFSGATHTVSSFITTCTTNGDCEP
jgi:subtilisin-like proprotein convertase family protein